VVALAEGTERDEHAINTPVVAHEKDGPTLNRNGSPEVVQGTSHGRAKRYVARFSLHLAV
jgi:hypothetical protein